MIQYIEIGCTRIAACQIEPTERIARRQSERHAVTRLVESLCGPGTTLSHNADGAPLIEGMHVSVSHSRRMAAVAINPHHPIGIDIEEDRAEMLMRVKNKFISDEESGHISHLLMAWTIKEAVYKAAGVRNLSILQGITIMPGMLEASALGIRYRLHHRFIGPTLLTLAMPIQNS